MELLNQSKSPPISISYSSSAGGGGGGASLVGALFLLVSATGALPEAAGAELPAATPKNYVTGLLVRSLEKAETRVLEALMLAAARTLLRF